MSLLRSNDRHSWRPGNTLGVRRWRRCRVLEPVALLLVVTVTAASGVADEPWRRHTVDSTSRGADGVRLADVNADGRVDIVTPWEEGGLVRVYVNPGPELASQPWPYVTVGHVASPEDAVPMDVDGDGATDVVSCCEGHEKTIFVHWAPQESVDYLRDAAWVTTAIPVTQHRQAWMFALPHDVDNRDRVDLVVGSRGKDASIGWLQVPSNARAVGQWRYRRLCDAGWIMSLQSHDMDGDGDDDVLASDRKGPTRGVFWLENPRPAKTDASAVWRRRPIGGSDREVMFLTRGRLDRDAAWDVLAAVRGHSLAVFRNAVPGPGVSIEVPLPTMCGTGKGVALGDINLDGRHDIVFSCENARDGRSGVRWLSATRGDGWQDHEVSGGEGIKFDRIELVDLDADSDLDILTCEEAAGLGVVWYENPTR